MADNIFTNEEFKELVTTLSTITTHIPEDKGQYIWHNYRVISGSNENTPCYCGSSAGLWIKAVNTIRGYIKDNADKYNA